MVEDGRPLLQVDNDVISVAFEKITLRAAWNEFDNHGCWFKLGPG